MFALLLEQKPNSMANKTTTVKIDEDVLIKVKEVCKVTRQTISGFISIASEKEADKILNKNKTDEVRTN